MTDSNYEARNPAPRRKSRNNPNVEVLTRRELAALYLIEEYISNEIIRVRQMDMPSGRRGFLMKGPTSGYLWTDENNSAINEFFEQHGWFERQFRHPNQVARIVRNLRNCGILYNPNNADDAALGASEELIPKLEGDRLYEQLIERYGHVPTKWPDTVPFDTVTHRAQWRTVLSLPEPAFARAE